MENAQKRRQDLLNQTRRMYSDKYKIPAVHPRYGNFMSQAKVNNVEEKAFTLKSFKLRLLIALILFVIYATVDYCGVTIGVHSGTSVAGLISETVDIQEVWNSW